MLWLLVPVGYGQVQDTNMGCVSNKRLLQSYEDGMINYISRAGPEGIDATVSSQLVPPGRPLEPACTAEMLGALCVEQRLHLEDVWSCTYGGSRATDGDPHTAWVEGVDGLGVGEILVVRVDPSRPVEIWAGYGKSASLFLKNARPRLVEVSVVQNGECIAAQFDTLCVNNPIVAQHIVALEDHNGYQPLPLPEHPGGDAIAVRLLEVAPGTTWQDTCISEIRNVPQ